MVLVLHPEALVLARADWIVDARWRRLKILVEIVCVARTLCKMQLVPYPSGTLVFKRRCTLPIRTGAMMHVQ